MRADRSTKPASAPVNTNTLSQQVYAHLRAGILDNTYLPGSSLPEEALAASLNVSRVPVREALRRLSAEGLVVIKPRQGATVTELTAKQFLDAYQVRETLEVLAGAAGGAEAETPEDSNNSTPSSKPCRPPPMRTTPSPSSLPMPNSMVFW